MVDDHSDIAYEKDYQIFEDAHRGGCPAVYPLTNQAVSPVFAMEGQGSSLYRPLILLAGSAPGLCAEAGVAFEDPDEDFMAREDYDYTDLVAPDPVLDSPAVSFDSGDKRAVDRHMHLPQHEHEPGQGNPTYGHLGHRKHEFQEGE